MIARIKAHPELSKYIVAACCENGICAEIDPSIPKENVVIIKVDSYYNAKVKAEGIKVPPSPDCLIIRQCERGKGFGLAIVELKNAFTSDGFSVENLRAKFDTALNRFIKQDFKKPLMVEYITIDLFFVSRQEIYRRDASLKLRMLQNVSIPFGSRKLLIKPHMPNPMVLPCYTT